MLDRKDVSDEILDKLNEGVELFEVEWDYENNIYGLTRYLNIVNGKMYYFYKIPTMSISLITNRKIYNRIFHRHSNNKNQLVYRHTGTDDMQVILDYQIEDIGDEIIFQFYNPKYGRFNKIGKVKIKNLNEL